jgi:FMN phosphatase YigB (HAD superfamily)
MLTENKHRYVIFDIDGTLANISHRQHWVMNRPRNWVAFKKGIPNDTPHLDIIWLLQVLSVNTRIMIVSGREGSEEGRMHTENWLRDHGITYEELHMRPDRDYRDDSIIKREILAVLRTRHGEPIMVFDDRDRVVKMWREEGVRCLQVAPGDF